MADFENIITSGFSKYVSFLIKGNDSDLYFALGLGNPAWDSNNVPVPSIMIDSLVDETYRKKIDMENDVKYVDPISLEVSNVPTSTLRIEVTISSDEYYGVVREYGIFAIDPTSTPNTGTLINYCCHKKQTITTDSTYHKYIYINT